SIDANWNWHAICLSTYQPNAKRSATSPEELGIDTVGASPGIEARTRSVRFRSNCRQSNATHARHGKLTVSWQERPRLAPSQGQPGPFPFSCSFNVHFRGH